VEGEFVRDELALCGDGDLVAPPPSGLQAPVETAAIRMSAEYRHRVRMTLKATTLCAAGYVSGTILHLKQGTDPHPQSLLEGVTVKADGFRLSVLFYLVVLEE
jgi:hypothetical protein